MFQRKTKIFVLRVACCQIEDLCHQEEEEEDWQQIVFLQIKELKMPETCSATRGAGNNRAFEVDFNQLLP